MRASKKTQRSLPSAVGQAARPDASDVTGVRPNTFWLLSAALFFSAAVIGLWSTQ